MPIPKMNHHGLLPGGIYDCTLLEVERAFAWNSHRASLLSDFTTFFHKEIRPVFPDPVLINGSFVTDKDDPADTDVILDLRVAPDERKWRGLLFLQGNQSRLKRQYRVDFWVNLPGSNDFSSFFQYVGVKTAKFKGLNPKHRKGILRLLP